MTLATLFAIRAIIHLIVPISSCLAPGGNVLDIQVGGFFGLILLIADIWAIVNVVQSRASTGVKVLWIVLILLLPLLGLILWLIFGPRSR